MTSRSLSFMECRLLLRGKRVGRAVFTDRALPSALPVNYLATDEGIVFRTDPRGLLARTLEATGDAVLGFEVDEVDEDFGSGWSVLVVGLAVRVQGPESSRLEEAGLRAWGASDASTFVRIPFDRVTGRAVEAAGVSATGDPASPFAAGRPVA